MNVNSEKWDFRKHVRVPIIWTGATGRRETTLRYHANTTRQHNSTAPVLQPSKLIQHRIASRKRTTYSQRQARKQRQSSTVIDRSLAARFPVRNTSGSTTPESVSSFQHAHSSEPTGGCCHISTVIPFHWVLTRHSLITRATQLTVLRCIASRLARYSPTRLPCCLLL
ncbi:hypothetical protein GQ53DRAFT_350454 [Thozetella sp. PMI_491]|nr:hypothetical protein GQ53DRAFT_350454 [Thozetella sp. PMI_491]